MLLIILIYIPPTFYNIKLKQKSSYPTTLQTNHLTSTSPMQLSLHSYTQQQCKYYLPRFPCDDFFEQMLLEMKKAFTNEDVINTPPAVIDFFARLPLLQACRQDPAIAAYLPDSIMDVSQTPDYTFLVTIVNTYTKGALSQLYLRAANEIAAIQHDRALKTKKAELKIFSESPDGCPNDDLAYKQLIVSAEAVHSKL